MKYSVTRQVAYVVCSVCQKSDDPCHKDSETIPFVIGTLRENAMATRAWSVAVALSLSLLASAGAFGASAAADQKTAAPETLAGALDLYKAQATTIRTNYEAELLRWPTEYTAELKKLEDAFTKEGNLQGVLAVQAETKRFNTDKTIGVGELVSEPQGLSEVQQKYRTLCENAEDLRDKRTDWLKKTYMLWLKNIRKSLTQAKKLEEAQAIDAELQRVEDGGDPVPEAEEKDAPLVEKAFFASADDLEGARKIYGGKITESTGKAEAEIKKWPPEYSAALQKLEEEFSKDGDLKGLEAVQEEAKRFRLAGALDGGAVVTTSEKLAELQQKFVAIHDEALSAHDERVERLKRAYVGRLVEIQKKLTMEKKLSDAINVDNEIKRIGEAYAAADSNSSQKSVGTSTSSSSGRSTSAKKGLVLYYSFDKDEGGKVTDRSGQKNNGVVHGAQWVPKGKQGGAYSFGGNGSSFIDAGNPGDFCSNFTVAVWVYPRTFDGICSIFSKTEPTSASGFGFEKRPDSDVLRFGYFNNGAWHFMNMRHQPPLNEWTSYAITHDGASVRGYFNGIQDSDVIPTSAIVQLPSTRLSLGINLPGSAEPARNWNGLIDEFMLFDRALSDAEVAALFKAQGGRPTKTIAIPGRTSGSAKQPPASVGTPRPKPLQRLDIASGSGEKYTMASLYRRVAPSVVVVSAPGSSGSGFCIGRSDIIMSNAHVVQSAKRVTVVSFTYNRNELVVQEEIGASVIYVNPTEDVAILQLDSHRHVITPLPVARKNPAAGIRVCALGSPGIGSSILAQTLTEGIVSAGAREFGGQSWLQHTAPVNPGNSGGPLLNELGEVVGMNTLKAFLEGVSFAIPAEKIREVFSH